jgi:hypothetical protein
MQNKGWTLYANTGSDNKARAEFCEAKWSSVETSKFLLREPAWVPEEPSVATAGFLCNKSMPMCLGI